MSYENAVLRHLKTEGKISQLQALREFGCMRLAAVVHRLRQSGHKIVTTYRNQNGKQYAVYRLEKPEDES